ncbi:MAG: hypothetical protein CVV32_03125 [Methanomicrobiales archaeon HGW-Methanomicrobiales-3]|nr:MAG: hypothetical protein CVV32_03125 [Methanomicrobiales archaeon HGW-Methanomicrobiales-3]
MNDPHPVRWKSMVGLGILGALLGLFMLFFSHVAIDMIVTVAGVAIILLSAIFLVEGLFLDAGGWSRWGIFGLAALGLLVGIVSILAPSLLVVSTGLLIGIFLLIYGIGEIAIGVGMVIVEAMVRMVLVMIGIFSMVVGLFLILNPMLGLDIFVWLVGMYLVVLGLMRVAHGLNERDTGGKAAVTRL